MSSLAANFRRVATELRRSPPFAGFWRFAAVKRFNRAKGLSATGIERRRYAADSIAA
jgi:hypothetical protein